MKFLECYEGYLNINEIVFFTLNYNTEHGLYYISIFDRNDNEYQYPKLSTWDTTDQAIEGYNDFVDMLEGLG